MEKEVKTEFNINKLSLPATIIIASLILGSFFYVTQANKQKSIERQQQNELEIKQQQEESKASEKTFENNLKCQTLLKDLKQRWNNVVGIYYSEWRNTCIVKYTGEDGEVEEGALESMQDN